MQVSKGKNGLATWLTPAADSLWRQADRDDSDPRLHMFNYLWSLWIFATLFFTPVQPSFWWSIAISYPLFTVLFVAANLRPYVEMRRYGEAMALIGFVAMFWNPAAWTYVVFGCVYVGMGSAAAPRSGMFRILAMISLMLVLAWWLDWPWFVLLMAGSVCISSGLGAMFGSVSHLRRRQLQLSHDEVRRLAAAAERERIGRDLHDILGHTLSLITLKLELSRRLFDRDHAAARRELEEAEKVARTALVQVRAAVTGIRAADLAAELASAHLMLESSGVAFECNSDVPELPAGIERTLALLLREAVTNVVRHAHARHVELALKVDAGNVYFRFADDGRGGVSARGNGLTGMRERVRALGGVLRIDSPRGVGTTLEVLAPLRTRPLDAAASAVAQVAQSDDVGRMQERLT